MKNLFSKDAWSGLWTALITPLNSDGSLDLKSLDNLIEHQVQSGVNGLILAGSTGEGGLLTQAQYSALLEHAAHTNRGRLQLIAGLGTGGTDSCLEKIELVKKAKIEGILVSPPAYVRPPQRGLIEHYRVLAREGLAVCVYEIPGRAACSIDVATLVELSKIEGVVAVKDASANLQRAVDSCSQVGPRLAMLSGDDGTFQPFLAAGGVGLMSVVSHFIPRALLEIQSLMTRGQIQDAAKLQAQINPFVDAVFCESNPIPTKALLYFQKRIAHNVLKLPLVPLRESLQSGLEHELTKLRDWV
jgi:4-hydroxy-tetrahydrodipicolinate synthase